MPVRMAALKKSTNINAEKEVEKRNPLTLLVGMQTSNSHYGEQCGGSLKNWN